MLFYVCVRVGPCVLIYLLMVVAVVCPVTLGGAMLCEARTGYTYYFYLPSRGMLTLVGVNQSIVEVYRLYGAEYVLVNKTGVNRFERLDLTLEKGFYELISTGRVTAVAWVDPDITTLYTSAKGGYVGREFILPGFTGVVAVHAFEDAKVVVYDSRGRRLQMFQLWQNETKLITLTGDVVFRVVSTGRIAVGQHADQGIMFMVDATGKFKGGNLFGGHHSTMGVLVVSAYQICRVKVNFVVPAGRTVEHVFTEKEVESNEFWEYSNTAEAFYWVVSTGDVTVLVGEGEHNNTAAMLRGISLAVLPAGETFRTFAPTAIIIVPFGDGTVRVNGEPQPAYIGQPIIYSARGCYEVRADVPVTIEVIGTSSASLAESTAWRDGECLVGNGDIVDYGSPKPSSKPRGGGFPISMITVAIPIAALAIIGILLVKRRRTT